MVLVAQRDPAYAIERVDWSLLLFFGSLFVVMRGFEQAGAVAWIDRHALDLVESSSPWRSATAVSAVMATLSNLISNVPAVILWRATVPHLPHPELVGGNGGFIPTVQGNPPVNGANAELFVGGDVAFGAEPKRFAWLARFEGSWTRRLSCEACASGSGNSGASGSR